GRKVGKLVNLITEEVEEFNQRVLPQNIPNLLNVAKVVISAAWQDAKILPSEKEAFENAFRNVNFTNEQRAEIEKEFKDPTPKEELVKNIMTREEKILILETSLLLVIADNEFHPKEKEFIGYLIKEFELDPTDFVILYSILPERVKKYITKEKLHETLEIKADEIETLKKFVVAKKAIDTSHDQVYAQFLHNWKNRSIRYRRSSVY
ncbi:MAG: TerB family tellurite resistance protein, partial [Candidatus Cloacimonetes bacterium]|nr:TerB family tellurite resistance protein [Candidatus Cloacimonadota bacterium]